ncbi:SsrA-binding protein SmpB [Candidatus Woesebacteria bacterium]|nr:SsrA-binding protein SmpB [Candidatus Woesebacteria bacterium]MCD8506939.1 SsrA-binding protein SmpB [Candidatus Woesebacteria bacterium]MCD8527229.1 SsrA-binding protein SmpB [Candidatus Woesebacteria bacterium]MCD8546595.1 SsrA-binding protein SmpB [Candidatus Woesebacteria bacterium]
MKPLLVNKKARFEYEFIETLTAGVVLTGGEVKMLRNSKGSLQGSFVRLISGEAWLINAQIPPYPYARNEDYDPKQSRKLLLKKKELEQLAAVTKTKGITLVPTMIGLDGRFIKVEVAIARGKNVRDRREQIRRRDLERQTARDLKQY